MYIGRSANTTRPPRSPAGYSSNPHNPEPLPFLELAHAVTPRTHSLQNPDAKSKHPLAAAGGCEVKHPAPRGKAGCRWEAREAQKKPRGCEVRRMQGSHLGDYLKSSPPIFDRITPLRNSCKTDCTTYCLLYFSVFFRLSTNILKNNGLSN